MNAKKALLLGAALTGLTAGSLMANHDAAPAKEEKAAEGKCHGVNECKGKSECGGANNSCSGKNKCGGQGWVSKTEADCKAARPHQKDGKVSWIANTAEAHH